MTTLQNPRSKELEALSVKASRVFVDEGLFGIEAEVVAVLDVSPRMTPLYADGSLQRLITALLALGMKFDDDGVVPVWTYSDEAKNVGKIRRENSVAWVEQNLQAPPIMRPGMKLPPSRFAPFIDAIAQKYFPREWATPPVTRQVGDRLKRTVHEYATLIEPRPCPVFVIVVTSGDCDDPMETSKLLRRASHLPIFWQFTAVAATEGQRPEFRFLRGLDKLTETHVDSCGFFEAENFEDAEALYRGLLGEFVQYIEQDKVKAMLQPPGAHGPAEESQDAIAAALLTLPKGEAERRERERRERERRRAMRDKETAAELKRADAWPKIASDAQDPDPAEPTDNDPSSDTEPDQRKSNPTTQPRQRVKRETMPYAPEAGDVAPRPPAPVVAPPPQPTAPLTPPHQPAAPPARRTHETRAFERVPMPPPRTTEPPVVLEGFDQDDLEDTVETAAERLARIRARREARKASEQHDPD